MVEEAYSAKLSLSTKSWNKALKSAGSATAIFTRSVAAMGKGVARVGKGIGKVGLSMGKALAVGAAGAAVAVGAMVKKVADAGDQIDKMSKRTGLSAEFLSKLKYAAELSGTSVTDMEKGVKKMQKTALDASSGLKTASRTFERLGISATDSSGKLKDSEALFKESVEALAAVENQTEKAAIAQELFGRAGTAMLPMLEGGTKGMNAMMQEAEKLGIVWTKAGAEDAAAFNDSLTRVQGAVGGLFQGIAVDLMPALTNAINAISAWITENKEWIAMDIGSALKDIVEWTTKTISEWGGLEGIIARVRVGFNAVVGVARLVGAAFGAVGGVVMNVISGMLVGIQKVLEAGAAAAEWLGLSGTASGFRTAATAIGGLSGTVDQLAKGTYAWSAGQFKGAAGNFENMITAARDVNTAEASEEASRRQAAAQRAIVINNQGVGNMTARDAKKVADSIARAQRQGVIPATAGG